MKRDRYYKKIYTRIGLIAVAIICFLLCGKGSYAEDTAWQKEYDIKLDKEKNHIKLEKYLGNADKLTIPAKATIEGVEYTTYIDSYLGKGIWSDDTNLIELRFESGIQLGDSLEGLFSDCNSLVVLDVSNFDTVNVKNINSMFFNCSNVTSLDLHSFLCSNVNEASDLLNGCVSLKEINTPRNLTLEVPLPGTFVDEKDTAYDSLPKNLSESLFLSKEDTLIDASDAVITVSDQIYTGKALKPSVTIKLGDEIITPENYSLSYSDNIDIGTATITVEFKGNYKGTATKTFDIKTIELPSEVNSDSIRIETSDWREIINGSLYVGQEKDLIIQGEEGYDITWKVDNTEVATITPKGRKATLSIEGISSRKNLIVTATLKKERTTIIKRINIVFEGDRRQRPATTSSKEGTVKKVKIYNNTSERLRKRGEFIFKAKVVFVNGIVNGASTKVDWTIPKIFDIKRRNPKKNNLIRFKIKKNINIKTTTCKIWARSIANYEKKDDYPISVNP